MHTGKDIKIHTLAALERTFTVTAELELTLTCTHLTEALDGPFCFCTPFPLSTVDANMLEADLFVPFEVLGALLLCCEAMG